MFRRIDNDTNGNPRYVCHYVWLLTQDELDDPKFTNRYNVALLRAKPLGGRKFHNKQFGGGIAFQCYDREKLENDILALTETKPKPESKIEWPVEVREDWIDGDEDTPASSPV